MGVKGRQEKGSKTLNIKDAEVYRLASQIAAETGESMTHVVKEALTERYNRLESRRGKASLEELLAIANRISILANGPRRDHAELLYDEHGLPK